MSYPVYRTLAQFLKCYQYSPKNYEKPHDEIDRVILEHLVNNTSLSVNQISTKLLFIRDLNHELKTATVELLKSTDPALMPSEVSTGQIASSES